MEDYSRGLRGRVGNAVGVLKRAWVRIPCLPSINKTIDILFFNTSIKKNTDFSAFFFYNMEPVGVEPTSKHLLTYFSTTIGYVLF